MIDIVERNYVPLYIGLRLVQYPKPRIKLQGSTTRGLASTTWNRTIDYGIFSSAAATIALGSHLQALFDAGPTGA